MTLHGEDTIISIRPIWGTRQVLTGGTVAASTITGMTNKIYSGHYNGGKMFILSGNQQGKVYNIVSNTTEDITVDRGTLTKSGGAVVNTDAVCLWPRTGFSSDTDRYILVDSTDLPTPKNEVQDVWAHSSGTSNTRESTYIHRKSMDATLNITPQNGAVFPFLFGQSVDTAATEATSAGSTTLAEAIEIGETVFDVASAVNLTANDYIRIGPAATGEIRKITDVSTNTITVDQPVRRAHANGVTVIEMENATGTLFTHTYSMAYDNGFRQWPFMLTVVYNATNAAEEDVVQMYWCQAKGFTLKNDGDKLQLSVKIVAYDFNYFEGYTLGTHDGGDTAASFTDSGEDFTPYGPRTGMTIDNDTDGSSATITAVTTTNITGTLSGGTDDDWDDGDVAKIDFSPSPTSPSTYVIPIYWNSKVSINGIEDGLVRSVNMDVDYGGEPRYYHNDAQSKYPGEIIFQRPKLSTTLGVRVTNKKFLDLLSNDTEFDNEVYYYLNSDQTQYIYLNIQDSQVTEVPHNLPPGGPIETDLNLTNESVTVTVVDTTQYW